MDILLEYKTVPYKELEHYINNDGFKYACQKNNLELMKFIHSKLKEDLNEECFWDCLSFISSYGYLEIFKWLELIITDKNLLLDGINLFTCCEQGHLEIAQYIYEKYLKDKITNNRLKSFLYASCANGCIDIFKWIYSLNNDLLLKDDSEDPNYIYDLIRDCFKYINSPVIPELNLGKNLEILKFIYEKRPDIIKNKELLSSQLINVIELNSFEGVKWIYEIYPEFELFVTTDKLFNKKYTKNVFYWALLFCDINIVKYIYEKYKEEINHLVPREFDDIIELLYIHPYMYYNTDNIEIINKNVIFLLETIPFDLTKDLSEIFKQIFWSHNIDICNYLVKRFKKEILTLDNNFDELFHNVACNTFANKSLYNKRHYYEYFTIDVMKLLISLEPNIEIIGQTFSLITLNYEWKNIDLLIEKLEFIIEINPNIENEIHKDYLFKTVCKNDGFPLGKWLYETFPSINLSIDNEIVLQNACKFGNLEIVYWLLEVNPTIDISISNELPLLLLCESGHLPIIKLLFDKRPTMNLSIQNEFPFRKACEYGNIEVAKWILEIKPEISNSIYLDNAFENVCGKGFIDIAKWLLEVNPDINISVNDEFAFYNAAKNNQILVVEWLLEIKPNIDFTIKDNYIFKNACEKNHFKIAEILCKHNKRYHIELERTLDSDYEDIEDEDERELYYTTNIIGWKIDLEFKGEKEVSSKEQLNCCVCFEDCGTITNCGHLVCLACSDKIENNKCPYCRQTLDHYYNIVKI